MSEFAMLYRGRDLSGSPEQVQKHLDKWYVWFKEMTAKGQIKDPGHPLEDGGQVIKGKQKTIHDGPYAEAKDIVAGFTLIEAPTLEAAVEISKGCPILDVGGSVEVRPLRQMHK
jgi:hypothetical protein